MLASLKKIKCSSRWQLYFVFVLCFLWLSFLAWPLLWPLTWVSLPVFLCWGYIFFRFIFELTVNRLNVPTITTCFVARQKMAKILEHEAAQCHKETYNVVDLGSGRGELARCIAKKIPKASVIGIEMAAAPYMLSTLIQRLFGPKNVIFKRLDFWHFDCSDIDAVVLYLGPITTQQMGEKLHQELKRGSTVISNTYPLLGKWKALDTQNFHAPFKETFYVYKR